MNTPALHDDAFTEKPAIGVSACLLGDDVRYNGENKKSPQIINTLGKHLRLIAVCPEVECGLSVPREPMQLTGDIECPRLMTINTSVDYTEKLMRWSKDKLKGLEEEPICGFILKCRSPSCALRDAKLYPSDRGSAIKSPGIFAGALIKHFPLIPISDEEDLADEGRLKQFVAQAMMVFKNNVKKSIG